VQVRDGSGQEQTIRVKRGVVPTSSEFPQSEDLLRNFAPQQAQAVRLGGAAIPATD
jgi:hypothetical protein